LTQKVEFDASKYTRAQNALFYKGKSNYQLLAEANASTRVELYGHYYDMTRPILFCKRCWFDSDDNKQKWFGFHDNKSSVVAYDGSREPLPASFLSRGVTRLAFAKVILWRPLCMHRLSSHSFVNNEEPRSSKGKRMAREFLLREVKALEDTVAFTSQSMASGNALVVSMATLTWRIEEVSLRLLKLFPALGSLDPSRIGAENRASPHQAKSKPGFGKINPPGPTCGFDMDTHTCAFATWEYAEPVLLPTELQLVFELSALLTSFSGVV